MSNVIKLTLFLFLGFLLLFSCKKEEDPEEIIIPKQSPPIILRYNIEQKFAALENNPEVTTRIIGYEGDYGIKYEFQYEEMEVIHRNFAYGFAQFQEGAINLTGENKNYVVIIEKVDFEGHHLYFKFDKGYDDFSVSPSVLNDSTEKFSIKNKFNERTIEISSSEFLSQKKMIIFYDK